MTVFRIATSLAYYPTLWFSRLMYSLRAWRPWDWIDGHVVVGAVPSRSDLRNLHGQGIRIVVNMCAEFRGHQRTLTELRMTQLWLPTADFCCPCEEDLLRGVEFVQSQVAGGRKVFIHCKAGRGRAPSLAMCYLMASRGIAAEEAYGLVRLVRPQVASRLYDHPEVRAVESRLSHPVQSGGHRRLVRRSPR